MPAKVEKKRCAVEPALHESVEPALQELVERAGYSDASPTGPDTPEWIAAVAALEEVMAGGCDAARALAQVRERGEAVNADK